MKKTSAFLTILLVCGCGLVAMKTTYGKNTLNVVAPSSWFNGLTTPAPSDVIPFDNPDIKNASFHLWSWQKFLSLTRSAKAKAPFESLVQVDNFLNALGDTIALADSSQAGTHGVLYAKDNSAILYTIHVNQQMFDFQNKYISQFRRVFEKYQDSTNRDQLVQNALHQQGLDTLNYPVGCFEVKTSWIRAASLGNPSDYYLTSALVRTASGARVQKVALLGMHIVGRVADHPEFIWATYEHDGMAPDYGWSPPGYPDSNSVLSTQDFLFYKANTKVKDCPMDNGPHSPTGFKSVFNIYTLGLARSFSSDTPPSTMDSSNNANIVSLNASVKAHLQKVSGPWQHYAYKGSLWLDVPNNVYKPGQGYLGNLTDAYLRGSRAISNISMETFAQLEFSGVYSSGSMNCFGCHGTVDYVNVKSTTDSLSYNLALSHLFKNALGPQVADVSGPDSCRNCSVIPRER